VKSLLVLYPIQPYAEALMVRTELPGIKYAWIYQQLMRRRYPDFQIIWVMFSEIRFLEKPDMSQLWEGISIEKDDIVLACGTSFKEHCAEKAYPDPKTILKACSQPIDELVIGGFHFWDCVERVAKYAYEQGINVAVDDDLTEFFFKRARNYKEMLSCIPVSREESMAEERKRIIKSAGLNYLEMVQKAREEKPWLLPI